MDPMDLVLDIVVGVLLLVGCLMSLTAGLGLIRLPDVLSRMHAATKPQVLKGVSQALAPSLQPGQLILVVAGPGVIVQLLQQHHVRLLGTQHTHYFIERQRQRLTARALVRAIAAGQVVPEHIALTGQVLHVPGHHLERLARLQLRRLARAGHGRVFAWLRSPGQAVDQHDEQREQRQHEQQKQTKRTGQGHDDAGDYAENSRE